MSTYFYGNRQQPVSGTGIAEGLEMPLRPERVIQAGDTAPVQTGSDVVLVTPTYAWRIPRWCQVAGQDRADRTRAHLVCDGLRRRVAMRQAAAKQLAAQKKLQYMGTAQIIMPENYIAMFNAPQKEQARSIVEQAEPALQKVLAQLKAGQEFPPPRENL